MISNVTSGTEQDKRQIKVLMDNILKHSSTPPAVKTNFKSIDNGKNFIFADKSVFKSLEKEYRAKKEIIETQQLSKKSQNEIKLDAMDLKADEKRLYDFPT